MERSQIAAELKSFFEREFPNQGQELTEETNLLDDWFVDSLGIVNTTLFLEEHFGIEMGPADINAEVFESIRSLTDYVLERQTAS